MKMIISDHIRIFLAIKNNNMKLPKNFEIKIYGLYGRLVNEEDAEFIVKLRTDPMLGKFIHATSPDIFKQKEWIREYQKRESLGLEYYFIFYKDGVPFGVNRLYHMEKEDRFTSGSWICLPNTDTTDVVASSLIPRIIAFEMLDKIMEFGVEGCHEDNKKVIKFNQMIGMKIKGTRVEEKGKYYTFNMTKEDFYKSKERLEKLLNLNS